MKLSVFSPALADMTLEEMLKFLTDHGVYSVEMGCGGFPGTAHFNAKELICDDQKIQEIKDLFAKYHCEIAALSCHGNPVHPNKEIAKAYQEDFEAACILAEKLNVERIITFSGCPGDSKTSKHPNWVTCPWPEDFSEVLQWQWNKVLIPYWKKAVQFAKSHHVKYICLEMHPGFCVYNPETLLKLRNAVDPMVGANFDPSHLIWQGVDMVSAIKYLKGAIYHFHAKDTGLDRENIAKNGVLDTKHYGDEIHRSWVFRTVGYGNSEKYWKDIFSALNLIGYGHVISIEHEDSIMEAKEGLVKAIEFLQNTMIINKKPTSMWWA